MLQSEKLKKPDNLDHLSFIKGNVFGVRFQKQGVGAHMSENKSGEGGMVGGSQPSFHSLPSRSTLPFPFRSA